MYQNLLDCIFGMEHPELTIFLVALLNAMGREGRGDRPTEVVLKAAAVGLCDGNVERCLVRPGL